MALPEFGPQLIKKEWLAGTTSIYETPFDFVPGFNVLVKQESHFPFVELIELDPCNQYGVEIFLQARGINSNVSQKIAEAIYPDTEEVAVTEPEMVEDVCLNTKREPEPETFIRMMLLQKDRGSAVIFTGNKKDGLENIYVVHQDSEVKQYSRAQLPLSGPDEEPVIEVNFSQIQLNPKGKIKITSCLPRTEFPLTPQNL